MLTINDLRAGYGRNQVLRGISLSVQPGEVVTVLGANGAGKTTLLKAICGLIQPEKGTVSFAGQDVTGKPAHEIVRSGLCLVPEGRQTFAGLTVLDNLMLAAQYGRSTRATPDEVSRDLASVFELFPRLRERQSQRAGTLSGGEGQMLAIGRALMCRPRLLMMDEPSLGLAPKVVQEIFAIIRDLRQKVPVLLVEQNAHAALTVSDRGAVLETGHVVLAGPSRELLVDPRVREHYLGTAGGRHQA